MSHIKLVCFDLDDTLIREIHSVMYLSILSGKLEELKEIECYEDQGVYDWIQADYLKAELAKGLHIKMLQENFEVILKPIKNICTVMQMLHQQDIKTILITAGPIQVAKVACEIWGIDEYRGSEYECVDDRFTGNILRHLGNRGKLEELEKFCLEYNISPNECMAIGDGATDIALFEYCGVSIGLNCAAKVADRATYSIKTEDLTDILGYI